MATNGRKGETGAVLNQKGDLNSRMKAEAVSPRAGNTGMCFFPSLLFFFSFSFPLFDLCVLHSLPELHSCAALAA